MLANQNRPQRWNDFLGGLPLHYLMNRVKQGNHPNALWITGPPGVGKSSLAMLYVRSTLCPNREPNSADGCGKCPICTSEPLIHPNLSYHLVKNSTSTKESLDELILTSRAKPIPNKALREDQIHRFIILDEAELIHATTMSALLDPLEFTSSTTTWILISMEPDKLSPVTREAIESRCKQLNLPPLPTTSIKHYLEKTIDPSIADMVASYANGNMRKAWSMVELIQGANLKEKDIESYFVGKANARMRSLLIEYIHNGKGRKEIEPIIKDWELINPELIASLLIKEEINYPNPSIELIKQLDTWAKSKYRYPLIGAILPIITKPRKTNVSTNSISSLQELNNELSNSSSSNSNRSKESTHNYKSVLGSLL